MKKRLASLMLSLALLMGTMGIAPTASAADTGVKAPNIIDNLDEQAAGTGDWTTVKNVEAYQGDYVTSSDGTFTWRMQIPKDAKYELCWYGARFFEDTDYASNAAYTLTQGGETVGTWSMTQQLSTGWHPLGQLNLQQGEATLTLSAGTGNVGKLMADAVRFEEVLIEGVTTLTVDNTDSSVQKSGADANWAEHTGDGSVLDGYFSCTGEGSDSTYFVWPLAVQGAGYWQVEVYIPDTADKSSLNSAVSYAVMHDGNEETATIDHTAVSGWVKLGAWYFAADGKESVKLSPGAGTTKRALVDAVRVTYMGKVNPDAEYIVVDNTDKDKTVIGGAWHDTAGAEVGWQGVSTFRSGFVGENYYSLRGGDDASFTWKFPVAKTGYYRVSVNIPDGTTGSISTNVRYQIETSAGAKSVTISHAQPAGYYPLGVFPLTAGDELQPVLKLVSQAKGVVCMVDAAMIEYVGTEPIVESGSYQIDLTDPQQTIAGLGVEIQSDSIASGNAGLPEEPNSVPHDLSESERDRFYSDLLKGFRYVRLAGGLFYRGTDEEGKHLQGRWDTQDAELAEMVEKSGVEGFNLEFWSPTPYFKASGKYTGGGLTSNELKMLRCYGPNFASDPVYHGDKDAFLNDFADTLVYDFLRMREAGLPIVQFSLQNEPPLTSVYGDYSFCYYTPQAYYETSKVVLPKLKAAMPDLFIHANSWEGQHAAESKLIKADAELFQCIDGWSHHYVGHNSNDVIDNAARLNTGTEGLPVMCNEFEYQPWNFGEQYDFRFVNSAQMIMNWMTFTNSPTFYWLHALKPLGNEESVGYSLGFWRKPGDQNQYQIANHVEEGCWDYNYPNYNAFRGFLAHMPWDSVRYTVNEDKVRKDQRIMAWKSPEGRLAFALTNRSDAFEFKVDTGLEDEVFHGYRLTSDCTEEIDLGTKTGGEIKTTLEPYTIEFWVQEEDASMVMADGVTLDKATLTLSAGESQSLLATVSPVNAANKSVRWTSGDSTIAKVDENGVVTGIKGGKVKITATAISGNGQHKAECTVTVSGFVVIDKDALQALYDQHKDKTQGNYTNTSFANFQNAIAKAKRILENDAATQAQVDDAKTELQNAVDGLIEKQPSPAGEHHFLRPDSFQEKGTWIVENDPLAFEGINLLGLKMSQKPDPSLSQDAVATVNVKQAGTYQIWVHAKEFETANNDPKGWTFQVGVNGETLPTIFGGQLKPQRAYVWTYGGEVELSAGENTISLKDISANYARCDGVFVTSNAQVAPADYTYEELKELNNLVVVNRDALEALYDEYKDIKQGNYTYDSFWPFAAALDAAKTVLEDENATQKQVDLAKDTLQNAVDSLKISVWRMLLKETIDAAELEAENLPEHIIPAVKEKFLAALENAKTLYAKADATDEELKNADDLLITMMHYLSFTANPEDLQKAVDEADGIIASGKYVADKAFEDYKALRDEAKVLLLDEAATDTEYGDMIAKLAEAKAKLTLKPVETLDLSVLEHQINLSQDAYNHLSKYFDGEAKEAFKAAYEKAVQVLEDARKPGTAVTQAEVNKAAQDLHNARPGLRLIPNKAELENLLNRANAKDLSKYTKESGAVLLTAIDMAKAVYDDPLATVEQVKAAEAVLNAAMDNLIPVKNGGAEEPGNKPGDGNDTPTGDSMPIAGLMLLSALSLGALLLSRRRKSR